VAVEVPKGGNRAAQVPPGLHEPVDAPIQAAAVTDVVVSVHKFATFKPPRCAVIVAGPALGGYLNLSAGVAAEFGSLAVGSHLELLNGIQVDAVGELLVDAR